MFAEGKTPGYSAKAEALRLKPGLVCKRKYTICDIVGYVVYDGDRAITSARTAHEAWRKVEARLARLEAD